MGVKALLYGPSTSKEAKVPHPHKNAPDAIDVYNMLESIGEEYHCSVEFRMTYTTAGVTTIARAYKVVRQTEDQIECQALHKRPKATLITQDQINFTLAFDIWCQLDGGGATAAQRGVPYDWRGRPEKLRKRTTG
jgi:hypothetical protein